MHGGGALTIDIPGLHRVCSWWPAPQPAGQRITTVQAGVMGTWWRTSLSFGPSSDKTRAGAVPRQAYKPWRQVRTRIYRRDADAPVADVVRCSTCRSRHDVRWSSTRSTGIKSVNARSGDVDISNEKSSPRAPQRANWNGSFPTALNMGRRVLPCRDASGDADASGSD